jgi:fructose-1,6-bisphosphatase/inositol monophosphatase family enzyme
MSAEVIQESSRLRFATAFVREVAGPIMMDNFLTVPDPNSITWKSDRTPLTQADTEINERFIASVASEFPEHRVLGEEENSEKAGSCRTWVIDPIDGTGPFSHGQATFVCAISELDEEGRPEVGVIYDPTAGRLFYAEKGKGTFLNGEKIHPAETIKTLDKTVIHLSSRGLPSLRNSLQEQGALTVLLNAIQYGSALVCAGFAGGAVYPLQHCWDGAAVKAIANEAGLVMTDMYGQEQRYDQPINGYVLANSKALHQSLLEEVRKAGQQ